MHYIFIGRRKEHPENASFAWNSQTVRGMIGSNDHLYAYFCDLTKWDARTSLTKRQATCVEEGISYLEPELSLTDLQKVRISAWERMNRFPNTWEEDIFGPINDKLATYILLRWIRHHHNKWYGDKLASVYVSD